jgi:hypothetical protein
LTAVALKGGIFVGILEIKSRAMSNMLGGVTMRFNIFEVYHIILNLKISEYSRREKVLSILKSLT